MSSKQGSQQFSIVSSRMHIYPKKELLVIECFYSMKNFKSKHLANGFSCIRISHLSNVNMFKKMISCQVKNKKQSSHHQHQTTSIQKDDHQHFPACKNVSRKETSKIKNTVYITSITIQLVNVLTKYVWINNWILSGVN